MTHPHSAPLAGQAWLKTFAPLVRANGYHPLPVPPNQKRTSQKGWQHLCRQPPTQAQIARWCEKLPHWSLAIACGLVVAIDIDEEDEARADALEALVRATLGSLPPVRFGRKPRRVLLYRAPLSENIATRRLGAVEILSHGAYVLAFGIHPITGNPYLWRDASPADCPRDALPVCTLASVEALVSELRTINGPGAPTQSDGAARTTSPSATTALPPHPRTRPDVRWVLDKSGRVIDGRDTFLAAQVYRAFAEGGADAETIADVAFARFKAGADLDRNRRDGARAWSYADALAKARALLARGKARGTRHVVPSGDGGFWTPATRHAFDRLIDRAGATGRLPPAAVAVSGAMLAHVEGDGSAFVAVMTIAHRLGLAPDTVKRARARLLAEGYWTAERVRGGRGHLALYRPSAAVLAGGLPLAQSPARANGDRSGHPNNQGWGISTSPTGPSSSSCLEKKDFPSDE